MGNYDFDLDLQTNNTMSVINNWIKDDSRILEFGPANGRLTRYLANERKCRMTIVEIDEESGKEAAEFAEKSFIGLDQGDIGKLYWVDDTKYDFIIFADVLEHLSNPKLVLQNCKNMLSENGKILVSIPNLAHNSVLINLMNDEFEYDKAGLLDNTHIHFFTYKSFKKMIDECELHIDFETPIYSRVGNNEINSRYSDVPTEIEEYLRQRTTGAIYQFVYCISNDQNADSISDVEILEIESSEELESSIYYKINENDSFSDKRRIAKTYGKANKQIVECNIEAIANGNSLRWDPMETNGIVLVENVFAKLDDRIVQLEMNETNAVGVSGNIYLFEDWDPWITFKIPEDITNNVCIEIIYQVLDYKMSDVFMKKIKTYTDNMAINVRRALLQDENEKRYQVVEQQKMYIQHLEGDIEQLNKNISDINDNYSQQKEYIEHLETDIRSQKEYIQLLENKLAELKGFGFIKVAIRRLFKK